MGAVYKNVGKKSVGKNLIPIHAFSEQQVYQAVKAREVDEESANEAVKPILTAELLDKYGLTLADYKRPGQTMSGLKKRFDKMVETSSEWFDRAIEDGFELNNERPGRPAMPAIPSIRHDSSDAENAVTVITDVLKEYGPQAEA